MAGLLDDIYKLIPLQARTLGETIAGDTSPITAENLSDADKLRLSNAIEMSRKTRQNLLDQFPIGVPTSTKEAGGLGIPYDDNMYYVDRDWAELNKDKLKQAAQYQRYFPNEDAIKLFQEGGGTVNYRDYEAIDAGRRGDTDITPSASIMNTLGQFRYNISPEGNVQVNDRYDFLNDYNRNVMPKVVADTSRYENLSNIDKAKLIAKETWSMPEQGINPLKGILSLPSRVGNAYVGKQKARDVDINFPLDIEALKRIRGY